MKNYPLPTGQNYWQPSAPVMLPRGGAEAYMTGPAIQQGPAPLYYPSGRSLNLNLGGLGSINDVNMIQLAGAVGGGILGSIMAGVINSVLPKKMSNLGNLIGIGLAPAMAIAGWFYFKESYTYDFANEANG